ARRHDAGALAGRAEAAPGRPPALGSRDDRASLGFVPGLGSVRMIPMRGRYLAALLAAAAVAGVLLWHSRTVTTNPPAPSPTSTESRGVLGISPTDEVPNDLTGVRYLLLAASKAPQVESLKQRYPG